MSDTLGFAIRLAREIGEVAENCDHQTYIIDTPDGMRLRVAITADSAPVPTEREDEQ